MGLHRSEFSSTGFPGETDTSKRLAIVGLGMERGVIGRALSDVDALHNEAFLTRGGEREVGGVYAITKRRVFVRGMGGGGAYSPRSKLLALVI